MGKVASLLFSGRLRCLGVVFVGCAWPALAQPLLQCPPDSTFSQVLDLNGETESFFSDSNIGLYVFERIEAEEPIVKIRWWGLNTTTGNPSPCNPFAPFYQITITDDSNGGIDSTLWFDDTVEPTITTTGLSLFGAELFTYDVTLSTPVSLPRGYGYLNIWAGLNTPGCLFNWMTSEVGDSSANIYVESQEGFQPLNKDLSVCVITDSDLVCPNEEEGKLRVQVIGFGGFPVSNATVTLNSALTGVYDAEDGIYEFPCLPFEEYAISVEAEGYQDATHFAFLTTSGQIDTVFLQIAPEGDPCGDTKDKGCSTPTTVFVSVLDDTNNRPIRTATVSIPLQQVSITQNTAGVYTIPQLGDGTYELEVEAPDFDTTQQIFTVNDHGTFNVVVRMDPLADPFTHDADINGDGTFSLGELLGVIQLFNALQYRCDGNGYAPGAGDTGCGPHSSDYLPGPGDFRIRMTELLRSIQLYAFQQYHACGETEDNYCTGAP